MPISTQAQPQVFHRLPSPQDLVLPRQGPCPSDCGINNITVTISRLISISVDRRLDYMAEQEVSLASPPLVLMDYITPWVALFHLPLTSGLG